MGGREYLGCAGALAVAAMLSGVGLAMVVGAWVSLFVGPIIAIVGAAAALVIVSARRR